MGRRDAGPAGVAASLCLVVVLLAGGCARGRSPAGDGRHPADVRPGTGSSTSAAAASAVPLPPVRPAAAPLPTPGGPVPLPAGVARALAPALAERALGPAGVEVVDVAGGRVLLADGAQVPRPAASAQKLLVAAAALVSLGPQARLVTRVLARGPRRSGVLAGPLVLEGAGDPTLTAQAAAGYPRAALVDDLAAGVAAAGIRRVTGGILGDGTLFAPPAPAAGWKPSYLSEGDVAPVSALEVDAGRVPGAAQTSPRAADPAAAAAAALAAALRRRGVAVTGPVGAGSARAADVPVAQVAGPPVSALVERMLLVSDNDQAEAFGRLLAVRTHRPATFAGAAAAELAALRGLGLPLAGVSLDDASGLSVLDRVPAATLVGLLRTAALPGHPQLRALLAGLPVAGFSGTLGGRFRRPDARAGAGVVRAKTGTLAHVDTLAGLVLDADGRLLAFAVLAGKTTGRAPAEHALDAAAAALAGCGCR